MLIFLAGSLRLRIVSSVAELGAVVAFACLVVFQAAVFEFIVCGDNVLGEVILCYLVYVAGLAHN